MATQSIVLLLANSELEVNFKITFNFLMNNRKKPESSMYMQYSLGKHINYRSLH